VTAKKTTTVVVLANSWRFDGPGVVKAIQALRVPYMRDRFGGGWLVPGRHGEAVIEWLTARGYRCEAML
jgi:hypothetical protein